MIENVENMIFEVLKKIQGDMATFRAETNERFGHVNERLDRLEDIIRKQCRETAGMLVMAKSIAGTFTEDLAAVEARVAVLEASHG